ncbi:hypothetical protein [Pseudomonas aeruginosa]|uniref:hypothetical protein n=1 Tax=Pseudomonas aeruginosa TaxID=287 RepID=UPI0037702EA0
MLKPNVLTVGRRALLARLQTISPANGYRTDAGTRVLSGWFNELIKECRQGFPLIVVQPAKEQPPEHLDAGVRFHRGFDVVGAVQGGYDHYEEALEDLQLDLLACLMPAPKGHFLRWLPRDCGITGLTLGAPEPYPPGDAVAAAVIRIPVYLKTIIEG